MSRPKYLWRAIALTFDGLPLGFRVVNALYDPNLSKTRQRDQGEHTFKDSLSGGIELIGDDYEWIKALPFSSKIRFTCYRLTPNGTNSSELEFIADSSRLDFDFDDDEKTVQIKLEIINEYTHLQREMNKTRNLIDIANQKQSINYKKQAVFQIFLLGSSTITNVTEGMSWEEEIDVDISTTDGGFPTNLPIVSEGFGGPFQSRRIIIRDSNLNPDISGIYYPNTVDSTRYTREDSLYRIELTNPFPDYKVKVFDSVTGVEVYDGANVNAKPIGGFPSFSNLNNEAPEILSGTGSRTRPLLVAPWVRMLSDVPVINGVNGIELTDANSLLTGKTGFKYAYPVSLHAPDPQLGLQFGQSGIRAHYRTQTTSTFTPKIWESANTEAGDYLQVFQQAGSTGNSVPLPVAMSQWTEVGYRFVFYDVLRDWYEKGTTDIILRDAYPIYDVIKGFLDKVNEDNPFEIKFEDTVDYSELLFANINPVTGQKNRTLFFTPLSNVKNAGYSIADTKEDIQFRDVWEFLWITKRAKFTVQKVNNEYRLRIEHISWYYNGGDYTTKQIGFDFNNLYDRVTGVKIDYFQNKWSYVKQELFSRLITRWAAEVSPHFEGDAIEVREVYAQSAEERKEQASRFLTDIDYINVFPQNVGENGFVGISAFLRDNQWYLDLYEIEVGDDRRYRVQNGDLAMLDVHHRYYPFDLPQRITINGIDRDVTKITRMRVQEIESPEISLPNTVFLWKTQLGEGLAQSIKVELSSRATDIKLLIDA